MNKSKSDVLLEHIASSFSEDPLSSFPLVRHRFSPRYVSRVFFSGDGRTKQSFKDECDVNRIMSRYMSSGILPEHLTRATAQFVDCTAVDFQEAQLIVAGARTLFAELPSAVRSRFRHSPEAFLEFAENPANGPALAEMGLATLRKDLGGDGITPPVKSAPVPPTVNPGGVPSPGSGS
ncbi:MAG: internal scaffolding protein [Microvirus sp.]|nr:MAG: internal scaffolding protein [Microvirus sp.]